MIGRDDSHAISTGIAEDCEAYLSGTYLDRILRRRATVPTWAWLNPLAHRDLPALAELAATMPGDGPVWSMANAVAWLAREIVGQVGDDAAALHRLQHDVLIGLESDLAAHGDAAPTPQAFVQIVMAALG